MDIEEEERKNLLLLKEIFKSIGNKLDDSTPKILKLKYLELKYDNFLLELDKLIKTEQFKITSEIASYLLVGIRSLLLILKPKLTEPEYQFLREIFEKWNI